MCGDLLNAMMVMCAVVRVDGRKCDARFLSTEGRYPYNKFVDGMKGND